MRTKDNFVAHWRGVASRAFAKDPTQEQMAQLAKILAQVKDADGKIREGAQPKSRPFELVPAKAAKP